MVDAVVRKDDRNLLVSLKWQQVPGTAEQKVPFEVICLLDIIKRSNCFEKAYLVLGGDGWRLREFYTKGGLAEYIDYTRLVEIVTMERFVALANKGDL